MGKKNENKIAINCLAFVLIFWGEICFYKEETLIIYILITATGIGLSFWKNWGMISSRIKRDNVVIWLTLIYLLFFFNGIFRLRKGDFNWDTLGYRYVEIIALFLIISSLLLEGMKEFEKVCAVVGGLSIAYLLYEEYDIILAGGTRIGDSLSGNVNVVGYNFGILSTLMIWFYCQEKRLWKLAFFAGFSGCALATGSKKVLIMLVLDAVIYFWYEKNRMTGWLKVLFFLVALLILVFKVPYLYNIIGERTINMLKTMLYGTSNQWYSHSTDVRESMIQEALLFFTENPILGGGWNYFYAHTAYEYEYSHCNYTEILCSFGIVGAVLFYSRYIYNIIVACEYQKTKRYNNLCILIMVLMVEALVLDWAAVTFSAQCVWYLPVIISAAAVDTIHQKELSVL